MTRGTLTAPVLGIVGVQARAYQVSTLSGIMVSNRGDLAALSDVMPTLAPA